MATKSIATKAPAASLPEIRQSGKLVERIAARFAIDPDKMLETLKATAFRQKSNVQVTNEHMLALLVVAEQYHLNPFTRELYAFASDGGIVPIISIDGWIRIINERPEFASMELSYAEDGCDNPWIECTIWRKDRAKPVTIREYLDECVRDTAPWKSHPRRMLRHKAIIQCARVAFGFGGVYDPDEGERIYAAAIDVTPRGAQGKPETRAPQARKQEAITDQAPMTEAAQPAADAIKAISLDQATFLADSLKEEGVELSRFLAQFEIGHVEELPAARYHNAVAWILEQG